MFSHIITGLIGILQSSKKSKFKRPFFSTLEARSALETLQEALISAVILWNFDPLLPFHIKTDSSGSAFSGILSLPRQNIGHWHFDGVRYRKSSLQKRIIK